jgi:hypothetical protein
MRELTLNETQEVGGAFLFMVVPGWIAYSVITGEVVAFGAYAIYSSKR